MFRSFITQKSLGIDEKLCFRAQKNEIVDFNSIIKAAIDE
ncbi:hypothetical protein PROSTU_04191 [Providencia stuartii ATCC 25827]|uniref:Uncharacterized protein n=1 Tax=Providencia stuartii ATCC 25827 TaxID=471874 RepID=A0AA86YFC1_PROST|nr:hypothetical protein PROSTU_04191 [Providencia stuartii ATCC 25827]